MNKTIFQLLFIVLFLLFLLAIVHIFDTKEGYGETSTSSSPASSDSTFVPPPSVGDIIPQPPAPGPAPAGTPVPLTTYNLSNINVQYHETAEDINKQLGVDVSDSLLNNNSDSTYYTSGTLKYNPANYVPDYEDTIYFSKLTGLGYQTPTINTNAQLSGFCKYDRYFPEKIEEKCSKLSSETCASTTCCVLMGGKCFAGNYKGPYFKAHYGDLDLRNKDKYYYMGRCYGNCIDDQTNYYDYNVTTRQTFPGFAEDNPAFLPNISDYLGVIAPNSFNTSQTNSKSTISDMKCRIDQLGNLVDSNGSVIAYNATLDANGNFVDSNGHILSCPGVGIASPVSAPVPVSSPISPPPIVSTTPFSTPTPAATPIAEISPSMASPVDGTTSYIGSPISAPTPVSTSTPVQTPAPFSPVSGSTPSI